MRPLSHELRVCGESFAGSGTFDLNMSSFLSNAADKAGKYEELLEDLLEYFDGKQDAEYFTDSSSPIANEEMKFHMRISAILEGK